MDDRPGCEKGRCNWVRVKVDYVCNIRNFPLVDFAVYPRNVYYTYSIRGAIREGKVALSVHEYTIKFIFDR